ncbi:MAG: polysaccharide biosynthesis tyrosine autokinase [Granulosicoccus sp.]|nr:polysaccharide biosynthesis tyrosine autokinase [Granulosicoccus sp.]
MSESRVINSAGDPGGEFWSGKPSRARSIPFDPLSYFRSILKYRWPIVLFTALITALAVVYVINAEPLYRSTQSLLLETSESNIVAIEDLVTEAPRDEGYVQTRIEMLSSREHARRVIRSLHLLEEPRFIENLARHTRLDAEQLMVAAGGSTAAQTEHSGSGSVASDAAGDDSTAGTSPSRFALATEAETQTESLAIDYFMSRLSVKQVPTTRLVRISYLSSDAELAARIANEVGLQYIQAYVESVQNMVTEVSGWLDVKLAELKATMDDSEARLLAFKRENRLVDVRGSVGGLTEQELLQSSRELAEARIALADARIALDEIDGAVSTGELIEVLPSARSDLMIQQTRVDINRLSREMDRQKIKYGERHPIMVNLRSEIGSLQSDLAAYVQRAIDSARSDYVMLQRRVASMESRLETDRQAVQNVGAKSIQLEVLQREVESNRELYYRFLNRMIETKSTEGLRSVNATVAEFASPSMAPVKPKKPLIVGLAFIGALMLSVLAALIASGLDDSIKHLADVEHRLGERLIGIIPKFRKKPGMLSLGKADRQKQDSRQFAEAFTTARTNLVLDQAGDSKILLLTSSVPGEGKSMSSIGLARAFARLERVLLIDADIRRPSIGNALKLDKNAPGLTSFIASKNHLNECIQHHQPSGIDVLCSGPVTSQPLEMLSSSQFKSILTELADSYDRIIIDCAPVEAVSDALLLSKLADQVIYIVKSHDTSIRMVNNGLEKLRSVHAPIAGVLLTQVDLRKLASYGADYEFHGHYDYYGYSLPEGDDTLTLDREELRSIQTEKRPTREHSSATA